MLEEKEGEGRGELIKTRVVFLSYLWTRKKK